MSELKPACGGRLRPPMKRDRHQHLLELALRGSGLLCATRTRVRFVPAESTERIGAHHESADAVEFSWNRSMWPSLLQVDDDHSLGRISRICSDTDANHRVILHQPVGMVFFG